MSRTLAWAAGTLGLLAATAFGCVGGAAAGGGKAPEPQAAAPMPEWEKEIRAKLEKPISFDFQNTLLRDVLEILQGLLNVTIVIDAAAAEESMASITLKVDGVRAGTGLGWAVKQAGLRFEILDGAIFVRKGPSPAPTPSRPFVSSEHAPPAILERLEKPISFDFQNTPLKEALASLQGMTEIPIAIDPSAAKTAESSLTLKVDGMKVKNALGWAIGQAGLRAEWRDGALRVMAR